MSRQFDEYLPLIWCEKCAKNTRHILTRQTLGMYTDIKAGETGLDRPHMFVHIYRCGTCQTERVYGNSAEPIRIPV